MTEVGVTGSEWQPWQEDRDLELMEKEEGDIGGAIGRWDTENARKGRVQLPVTLLHR